MAPHVGIDDTENILTDYTYSPQRCANFSTCMVESLCDLFDTDPTAKTIDLDKELPLDSIDKACRFHSEDNKCSTLKTPLGDYNMVACSCGYVAILGDRDAHERGELELPPSMRSSLQVEAGGGDLRAGADD